MGAGEVHGWTEIDDPFVKLFDTTQVTLETALRGAALRQDALTENLANVNTPGYGRKDVDFHGALREALAAGPQGVERVRLTVERDPAAVLRADGSGIDVDVESSALAKNGLEFQALVSVARGRIDIIRSAIGVA